MVWKKQQLFLRFLRDESMYEFYDNLVSPKTLKQARHQLQNIYNDVPETIGCMENLYKGAKCGSWCCEHQFPSLYYSEFLNTWNTVINTWSRDKIAELIASCIRQYFDDAPTKSCVFWNKDTKLCSQHTTRPLACRIYGQEPHEEFKPKYERLKILYQNDSRAVIREQCSLVKTKGKPPTKQQIEQWDKEIKLVEEDIGISRSVMTDANGGSYRSYKDHILLQIGKPIFLNQLQDLRMSGNKEEQERFVQTFINDFEMSMLK